MPSPIKEYRCLAHGPFESRSKAPKCPHGCTTVEWSPRTPPMVATRRGFTQQQDALQMAIAQRYGLTDLKSADPGESMRQAMTPPPKTDWSGSSPMPKPQNLQEVLGQAAELRARGLTPPTMFVAAPGKIGLKDGAPFIDEAAASGATVSHYSDVGSKAAPPIDNLVQRGQELGRQRFQNTLIVNRVNPEQEREDFDKALEIEKTGTGM